MGVGDLNVNNLFVNTLAENAEFQEAISIIEKNSDGTIYLIGGAVYRVLCNILYGIPLPAIDFDFIVEHAKENFQLPAGWGVQKNRYGNPKFMNGSRSIDFVPVKNHR